MGNACASPRDAHGRVAYKDTCPASSYSLSCHSRNGHPLDPTNYMCSVDRKDHYVTVWVEVFE